MARVSAGAGTWPAALEQVGHVDQVGQHLAVVGRGALVVAAISQHLHAELADQQPQRPAQQRLVAQEDGQPGQRLEVLDQVVAADVGLQVTAQEPGVGG